MYPSNGKAALLVALEAVSALEGAPPILVKERKALKSGKLSAQSVLVELGLAEDSEEESD